MTERCPNHNLCQHSKKLRIINGNCADCGRRLRHRHSLHTHTPNSVRINATVIAYNGGPE